MGEESDVFVCIYDYIHMSHSLCVNVKGRGSVAALPSEIFSPESAGSRKTNRARPEMRTQGMSRLRP